MPENTKKSGGSARAANTGKKFRLLARHTHAGLRERLELTIFPLNTRRRQIVRQLLGRTESARAIRTADIFASIQQFCNFHQDKNTVVIFSATKFIESEGQRTLNFAKQFAARGYRVVFVYWRWAYDAPCEQLPLESGILKIPIDQAQKDATGFISALTTPEAIALLTFPMPELFPLMAAARGKGWQTVYDILDDWEEFHKVGQAIWYDKRFEKHFFRFCGHRFAVNEILRTKAMTLGFSSAWNDTKVHINRNGLKEGIHMVDAPRPLERGSVTLGFFGYLANGWFNWELVNKVARRRPQWKIYIIGYGQNPKEPPAENVIMLGKKPQTELASYAANWDVGVIPFVPNPLSEGADPIKTYEYFAMDLPVVASGVDAPPGAELLYYRADTESGFIQAVEKAVAERKMFSHLRQEFAARSTWRHRVDDMISTITRKPAGKVSLHDYLFGGAP